MIAHFGFSRILFFIGLLINQLAHSQTVAKVVYHDDPTPTPIHTGATDSDFSTTDSDFSRDSIAVGDYLMDRLSSSFFVGPPLAPAWTTRHSGSVAVAANYFKKIKIRSETKHPIYFESLVGKPSEIKKKLETNDPSKFAAWQDAEGKIQFEWKTVPGERVEQYSVLRQVGKGFWEVVGKVRNAGGGAFRFADENPPAGKISYRLKTTSSTGRPSYGSVILLEK